ncbi:MAG: DUF4157 domain-containing protein [Myxococcota bacterium]
MGGHRATKDEAPGASRPAPSRASPQTLEREADRFASGLASVPSSRPRTGTAPLSSPENAFYSAHLGVDLSHVRVHRGPVADRVVEAHDADALNVGHQVFLGSQAQRAPHGSRLLPHELAHVAQRSTGRVGPQTVLHKKKSKTPTTKVKDVFPFAVGDRVAMGTVPSVASRSGLSLKVFTTNFAAERKESAAKRLREDSSATPAAIAKAQEEAEDARRAANGLAQTQRMIQSLGAQDQEAEVTVATDDVFEAVVAGESTIPAAGAFPEWKLKDLTLSLRRALGNEFSLSLTGTATGADGKQKKRVVAERTRHLEKKGDAFVFSHDTIDEEATAKALAASGKKPGDPDAPRVTKRVAESQLVRQDGDLLLQALIPVKADALRLRKLPKDEKLKQAAKKEFRQSVEAQTRARPQRFMISGGASALVGDPGTSWNPILGLAWQYNFRPAEGEFTKILQVPLALQVNYSPTVGILGGASTGLEASFDPLVPLNVTVLAGVGGGQAVAGKAWDEDAPRVPMLGPMVGVGAGFEAQVFRIDVRYQYLINVLGSAGDQSFPGAHLLNLAVGLAE